MRGSWLSDDPLPPAPAREAVASPDDAVVVSVAATTWEIAIKRAAGRLDAPDDLLEVLNGNDLGTLPISAADAVPAGGLPRHHSDPYDRMLIAEAVARASCS
jgi:PIN domain nuclease of toxin-antitoxin system